MNVVIFASDAKALSSLNSVIQEASKQGIRLFAMVTHSTQLRHPKSTPKLSLHTTFLRSTLHSI